MTPLCQITRNGGCPSRTADQIWKSPTGCAILKSQISTSPHQKVRRIPVFQTRHSLPLFPLPLPLSLEGFPKGRNRSFAPLCRFKGVRGEIEIPPRFSLGGRGGTFSFQKRISPWLLRTETVQFRREFWPHVGASNQTGSPYSAQVLLSVTFTSMNFPIRSFPPFSRTSRLPSVREARGKFSSSLSPSTSTRTVLPT